VARTASGVRRSLDDCIGRLEDPGLPAATRVTVLNDLSRHLRVLSPTKDADALTRALDWCALRCGGRVAANKAVLCASRIVPSPSLERGMGDRVQEVRAAVLRAYRALVRDPPTMAATLSRRHVIVLVVRYGVCNVA
jgi:hypothetical protein